jgi:hemolysin activation/secretion protein
MKRSALVVLAVLAFPFSPDTAAAQPVPPASGPLPQLPPQRNPVEMRAPQDLPSLAPSIRPPPLVPQTGPGAGALVRIGRVSVTGNDAIPDAALAAPVAGLAGATVTLARIEEARLGILRLYREAGYAFTAVDAGLAPLPDGEGTADLVFGVTEGQVTEVKLEGDIGPAGTQVLRFLNRLIGMRPVSTGAIERALLLASDIPGVTVRGTLRPLPDAPGALQLVAAVERRWVSGYLITDNRGYRLVGPWEALFVAGVNAVTEFGERTELAAYGAQSSSQWFLQASTEAFLGGSGLRARRSTPAGGRRGPWAASPPSATTAGPKWPESAPPTRCCAAARPT